MIRDVKTTGKTKEKRKKVKPEYEVGELVIYGSHGVCRVDDITRMTMPGTNVKNHYYCLVPIDNETSRIFAVVGQDKVTMRRIMSKKEATGLIDCIESIPVLVIENEKVREETYKNALRTCESKEWVSLIKTLYQRNKKRAEMGKKSTTTDERYLKEVKKSLFTELSVVLDKDKDDVEEMIVGIVDEG